MYNTSAEAHSEGVAACWMIWGMWSLFLLGKALKYPGIPGCSTPSRYNSSEMQGLSSSSTREQREPKKNDGYRRNKSILDGFTGKGGYNMRSKARALLISIWLF